jgi:hypothetical protein
VAYMIPVLVIALAQQLSLRLLRSTKAAWIRRLLLTLKAFNADCRQPIWVMISGLFLVPL